MLIVAGHVIVDPEARTAYLSGCVPVVEAARDAPGCLDFSLSADLVDPGRVNLLERWESQLALDTFRGQGPTDDQRSAIRSASVAEYEIADVRPLS